MNARTTVDHDAKHGPLRRCQISGSEELHLIIDLGHQPPCDALLDEAELADPEISYPLRLMLCPQSGLAQLDYVVPGEEIYPPHYPYRAGISKPLADYQAAFAADAAGRIGLEAGELVVDIGCNDGALLAGFKALGYRTMGVEPTNIAQFAWAQGIEAVNEFFTERVAKDIVEDLGEARLVTMTNVFAHMAELGEVMRGIDRLLARDGVFITESHYLLDVLEKHQFDTIYHEHIRTYSLRAIAMLVEQYGLEVFDVERASRYGGNLRAYIGRRGRRPVEKRVAELQRLEEQKGLHDPRVWAMWRSRVLALRDQFMGWLVHARRTGRSVAGKSCPGRAATLINFYGIRPDQIGYLAELPNSLKLGKYLPGAHLPVVDEKRLFREQPDDVVLFSWHYGEVIAERLRAAGLHSRLVMPLPHFEVLPA